ncbi:DUF305 domain-containing protein [Candidatus Parcubacteria bacterium]|nr:MAG: DUF305 domain-containing protein [Candidatus Parcubacteria bacterium]
MMQGGAERNSGFNGMMGGSRTGMSGNMDAHFIEQMIPHHADAVLMAEIALERADHQELKQLAWDIKDAQTKEINEMKEWYKNWFGTSVPGGFSGMMSGGMMGRGMMGDATDIAVLEKATPFDKEFIEQMIPHHQMAVMMAQMLLNVTDRPEMNKLAQDIISSQTSEIEQMREWYRSWYSQ